MAEKYQLLYCAHAWAAVLHSLTPVLPLPRQGFATTEDSRFEEVTYVAASEV